MTTLRPAVPVYRGARVVIIAGDAKGVRGVATREWPRPFGVIPQWVVASCDYERVMRADYLRVEES